MGSVYMGGMLKPQPVHSQDVLARAVRFSPGASSQDPSRSMEDPRRNFHIVPGPAPKLPDRPGDKTGGRRGGYLTTQDAIMRWFRRDSSPRTSVDLSRLLGTAHSSTGAALRILYRDGRVQRRRGPGGAQVIYEYWPAGTEAPPIDYRDTDYPFTLRLLALLADGRVYTSAELADRLACALDQAQAAVSAIAHRGEVDTRACIYARGSIAQYRKHTAAPWPLLPEGWRLAAPKVRNEGKTL